MRRGHPTYGSSLRSAVDRAHRPRHAPPAHITYAGGRLETRRSAVDPTQPQEPLALSWSGGKDSACALSALRAEGPPPSVLLTTVTATYDRVSMHGVRRELLARQAAAAALPLVEVPIPAACPDDVYEAQMREALRARGLGGVSAVAFGDLFLADVRAYRERQLAKAGKQALFPLWGEDTAALARRFVATGFAAVVVCVDPTKLDPSFAGRPYDARLLDDLPGDVDPCGENGEFHTFVSAGPIFAQPISCKIGPRLVRDGFVFCDLIPL
jgi:uncharacterized protein (TIGR00290 family)